MIILEDISLPAFSVSENKGNFCYNKKFLEFNKESQEKILQNFNDKNFLFSFQDRSYHIIEINSNIFIITLEQTESHVSIREATRHSMALQMRILNELGEGVFIEDKTEKIIFANKSAEKILDLAPYEIVGQTFLSFIYPEEEKIRIQRILKKFMTEIEEAKSIRFETQFKNENSDVIYLLVYYSIMMTNKTIEGALITVNDISDMKKLTKEIQERSNELIQAEKLTSIGLLASGISHELNNPLAFVISNTSTLEDYIKLILDYVNKLEKLYTDFSLHTRQQSFTKSIDSIPNIKDIEGVKKDIFEIIQANQRGLSRLSDVISDLRKFSHSNRVDSDKKDVVDVAEPIKLALNLLSYELKSIDVQFQIEEEEKPYLILGNTKLYQIFLNIIYNASQAINEKVSRTTDNNKDIKGIIKINIYESNKKVVIQISDNGSGINEKSLPRLFDPFYTTKPPGIGTGLGLSISQRIVNDLGGYILAESGNILSGATFTLYFPVYEPN